MLKLLRWLRHGPLAFLGPVWLLLGRAYRKSITLIPGLKVNQSIGPYGPFKLQPQFSFTDLSAWGGGHNKGFAACIEACRGKSCVFDVGGHVGFVALPAASVLAPGGKLIAFEPADANAKILRDHLAANGFANAEVIQAVVGEEDGGSVKFFESVGYHGQNSRILKSAETLKIEHGAYIEGERPMISLDALCKNRNFTPEVIKIDVEGGEINVLRGARDILAKFKPIIFLSVHPREISLTGESLSDLENLIEELNYELVTIEGAPIDMLALDEYLMRPQNQN